ncbi:hypothetical protein RV07_GL001611 [Enterococcus malodoratus]|nr:hypothetical protein RV07_GL001611 [Enterococcus malodoratus]
MIVIVFPSACPAELKKSVRQLSPTKYTLLISDLYQKERPNSLKAQKITIL